MLKLKLQYFGHLMRRVDPLEKTLMLGEIRDRRKREGIKRSENKLTSNHFPMLKKDSDAGRDCGQEEKEMTEDEMAGWHHRFNGHEFD